MSKIEENIKMALYGAGCTQEYAEEQTKELMKIIKSEQYKLKKSWLEFNDVSNPKNKTKRLHIRNKESRHSLGNIEWDCGWRQYVFDDGYIKLSEGCIFEIFSKIGELKAEQLAQKED